MISIFAGKIKKETILCFTAIFFLKTIAADNPFQLIR
jgi:hypothetical protein